MDLYPYFQPWFQLGYYILLVPFKVEKDGKTFTTTTNQIQRVLCGVLHTLVCISVIFEINGELVQNAQNTDPGLLLRILQRVNSASHCYAFFYIVWQRRDVVLASFGQPEPYQSRTTLFRSTLFTALLFLCSIFAFASWVTHFRLENIDYKVVWRQYGGRVLYDIGLPQSTEISDGMKVWIAMSLLARFSKWLFTDLLIGLTLISSYISFTIGTQFYWILLQHSPFSDSAEYIVFDSYKKLKEVMNKLNDFLGPTYTVSFASLITICAFNIVDILNSKSWNLPIVMFFYYGMFFTTFILAAHAHFKISYFKTWLLSRPKKSATTLTEYLEVENWNLGLKGGPLFTITYGFLGTAFSVLLTYAIITIQFKGSTIDSSGITGV